MSRKIVLCVPFMIVLALLGCGSNAPTGTGKKSGSADPTSDVKPDSMTKPDSASKPQPAATKIGTTDTTALNLPPYAKQDTITGSIKSRGSDTMSNLMKIWIEGFKKFHPSVTDEIQHNGSGDAPKALIDDLATFGAMSRDWEAAEIEKFNKQHGYDPQVVSTCIDMLAVYVHKDNPIQGLSLEQIDAIFSKERKGGYKQDIKTWGDLGLTGEWADKPIVLYGRNSASGTYKYFKEHAMFKGTYKDNYKEQAGSSGVIGAIATEKYAIGYSGIGYADAGVKTVPLCNKTGQAFVAPVATHAYDETYPLSRFLYLSFKHQPGTPLDPLRREFLKFILSKEGQELVQKDQFLPLAAEDLQANLKELGLVTVGQ